MAYNKFIKKDGTVFLDLTADTVTEADVAIGKTFHKADGTLAIGTASGGGGSSLPAGVYLKKIPFKSLTAWQKWFVYNGELYAVYNTTGVTPAAITIYKYTPNETVGTWTAITTGTIGSLPTNGWLVREVDGIIHFLSNQVHATFDGTSFVNKANLIDYKTITSTVYDNKLLVFNYGTGIIYYWDSATDTLVEWLNTGWTGEYYSKMLVINGELYFIYANPANKAKVYKYKNEALEYCGDMPTFLGGYELQVGNTMYELEGGASSPTLRKIDYPNRSITTLGALPSYAITNPNISAFVYYNDKILYMVASKSNSWQNVYELTIVEDTATE